MRRVRGRSLLLLLAFTLVTPKVFADDDEIMRGADLVDPKAPVSVPQGGAQGRAPVQGQAQGRAPVQGQAQGGAPVQGQASTAPGAPDGKAPITPVANPITDGNPNPARSPSDEAAYQTDLRETVSELQEEVYRLREELDELKKTRDQNPAEFQRRVDQANQDLDRKGVRQNSGISGSIERIDGQISGRDAMGRAPGDPNYGRDAYGRAPNDPNYGRDAYGRAPGDPNFGRDARGNPVNTGANQQQQPQKMSWWQKLLMSVLDGVGKGLQKLADRKFGQLQDRANTSADRLGNRYPGRADDARNRINNGIEEAWRNGRPVAPSQNAPRYNVNDRAVSSAAFNAEVSDGRFRGNLSLLPRVTDDTGTHPVIDMPLGVGD